MYRVLIVDDSPTARQLLTQMLGGDADIHVVGSAKDGAEAVEMTEQLRPDVITMDIRMPRMDGFEATKEIMIRVPTPILIVSASPSVGEVDTAMRALRAGALTLLAKPPGPTAPDYDRIARQFVDTVKAMADVKVVTHYRSRMSVPAEPFPAVRSQRTVRAVAIAASTGGPPALQRLLSGLPDDFPAPILVVQHIAPGFVNGFASWLDSAVGLRVKVAEQGELLQAGTVYIAPEDYHLGVSRRGSVALSREPPLDGFRPAGTALFQSVAQAFESKLVAVVLTGMGKDGVDGLRAVRDAGGLIVVQDERSCVVFGMPGAAVAAGLVDAVVSLDAMARHLLSVVQPTVP